MPITIEEAKKKRSELEKEILDALKGFEAYTGVDVKHITCERYHGGASRHGILESVTVEVEL